MSICVINYGVGNIHSALKALKRFHDDVVLTDDTEKIFKAEAIVLPGVGAFAAGMEGLRSRNLIKVVQAYARSGKPVLGICLGAQLMLSKGFEFGEYEGLGIIPGTVEHFPTLQQGYKTPNIGWNRIDLPNNVSWNGTILEDLPSHPMMYFVHSFIMKPEDPSHILAETEYGGCTFASVIRSGNVYGCQFHPEKSSTAGLNIIENFVNLARVGSARHGG